MTWLLLPMMAFAFSSTPKRACTEDVGCLLVKDLVCGEIQAIAMGQDAAWASLQAKEYEKMKEAKAVCPAGDRPDHRDYAAVCQQNECVAIRQARKPEYVPPPPAAAGKRKK